MNAKEYFSQAKCLDTLINAKIRQVEQLNDLATHATSALTGMPHDPNHGRSAMADTVVKIVDLQHEIDRDIDSLVDLKRDILEIIKAVPNREYRAILEKRYINLEGWEKIASDMCCDLRWLYRLHGKALGCAQEIMNSRN